MKKLYTMFMTSESEGVLPGPRESEGVSWSATKPSEWWAEPTSEHVAEESGWVDVSHTLRGREKGKVRSKGGVYHLLENMLLLMCESTNLHVLKVLPWIIPTPLPMVWKDLVGLSHLFEDLLLGLSYFWLGHSMTIYKEETSILIHCTICGMFCS